jgi:hypothetical protein
MSKRYFKLSPEDEAFIVEFGLSSTMFEYKSDKEINVKDIIVDKMVNKLDDRLISIKHKLPLSLIKGISKDRKYGLLQGKVYMISEAKRKMKEAGLNVRLAKDKLTGVGYISSAELDKLVASGVFKEKKKKDVLEPLVSELAKFDIEVSKKTEVYSMRSERSLSLRNQPSVWNVKNKVQNSIAIEDIAGYEELCPQQKVRARDYAYAVADDTLKVKNKLLYVGADKLELESFIERLSK